MISIIFLFFSSLLHSNTAFAGLVEEIQEIELRTSWTYKTTGINPHQQLYYEFDTHNGPPVYIFNPEGFAYELEKKGLPLVTSGSTNEENGMGYTFRDYEKNCAETVKQLTHWKMSEHISGDYQFQLNSDPHSASFSTLKPSKILAEIRNHTTPARIHWLGVIFPEELNQLSKTIAQELGAEIKITDDPALGLYDVSFTQKDTHFAFDADPQELPLIASSIKNHGATQAVAHYFNATQFKAAQELAQRLHAKLKNFCANGKMIFSLETDDYERMATQVPEKLLATLIQSGKKHRIVDGEILEDFTSPALTHPCNTYLSSRLIPEKVLGIK